MSETPDPKYAIGWIGPRSATKPKRVRSGSAQLRLAQREMAKFYAERDARWDRNRARYGQAEPACYQPKDFDPGGWERFVADHPNAINVVAWRKEQEANREPGPDVEPAEIPKATPPIVVEVQGKLF